MRTLRDLESRNGTKTHSAGYRPQQRHQRLLRPGGDPDRLAEPERRLIGAQADRQRLHPGPSQLHSHHRGQRRPPSLRRTHGTPRRSPGQGRHRESETEGRTVRVVREILGDLSPALSAELTEDAGDVVLYGAEAYVELLGELGVGTTLETEGEDLFLFGRQPGLTGSLPETYRGLFFVPC